MNSDKQKCKAKRIFIYLFYIIVYRFLVLINTFDIYTYPFVFIVRDYNGRK